MLREGLERLLGENEVEVVGSCETAEDLRLQVRSCSPDVAIVDIRLPPTHNDEGMRAALEMPPPQTWDSDNGAGAGRPLKIDA